MTSTLQKRYKGYKSQYYKIQTWYSSRFMPNGIKQIYVSRKIRVTILLRAEKKYIKA